MKFGPSQLSGRRNMSISLNSCLAFICIILFAIKQVEGQLKNSISPIEEEVETTTATITTASPTKDAQDEPECGLELLRLSKRIIPYHYDLIITTDLDALTFEGAVQISLRVGQSDSTQEGDSEAAQQEPKVNQIALHADDSLKIHNIWYLDLENAKKAKRIARKSEIIQTNSSSQDGYLGIEKICRDSKYQLLVIDFAQELKNNSKGQLHLTFSGSLSDDLRGFYKSSYKRNNQLRYHATTQFQAMDARRVFPCFDEPAMKATFNLTLVHPSDRIALSNMKPIYESDEINYPGINGKRKLVRFYRTPPMSTYLLAFVIGEFDYVEKKLFNETLRVRVYTPVDRSHEGQFALNIACKTIEHLQNYFGIDFPLAKLDLIAIPDFEAGAMENWGLITFKETQLLVDDSNTSPDSRALIASTIVHELAHQWFGNLVTMEWWNDLWLNEGFATWMEYELAEELFPELNFTYHYLLDSHIHALNEDSFRSAHPIQSLASELEDPHDVDDLFDAISYNKAAAIIRLLHDDYLKPEPFKAAMRVYLAEHKYANANTEDLWRAMESSSQLPVRQFMQSWIGQSGHPLVTISYTGTTNATQSSTIWLEQERFLTNVVKLDAEELQQRWIIPLSVFVSDGGEREQLIRTTIPNQVGSHSLALPDWFNATHGSQHWLKMNANFSGFFRAKYPTELYSLWQDPIKRKKMSAIDRLNVVDEAHTLVMALKMPSDQLVNMLTWFEHEDNGAVQNALVDAYSGLLRVYEHHNLNQKVRRFGQRLLGVLFARSGKISADSETANQVSHLDKAGRFAIFNSLVFLNYQPAVRAALELFQEHQLVPKRTKPIAGTSSGSLAIYLRRPVYAAVARRGSDAQFERLFEMFNQTESREERVRLAQAMAKSDQLSRLERTWSWLLAGQQLDDKLDVLTCMLGSTQGRLFVRRLLDKQLEQVVKLNDARPLSNLIEELCISMGARQFPEMSKFFSRHSGVTDWRLSRDYIKRMLDWQTRVQSVNARALELALDDYLSG